ncbi:MAG: hypothetical protein IPM39_05985 [Chloroflexi bacterium]|nr:hypothetical protein [Chloroflexota bacterium]
MRHLFDSRPEFSLLRPLSSPPKPAESEVNRRYVADLGLDNALHYLAADPDQRQDLANILLVLEMDTAVIGYRQDVMADLLTQPALVACFQELMPTLDDLTAYHFRHNIQETSPLYEVAWRAGELENVVTCITALAEAFTAVGDHLQSAGLQALRAEIGRIQADETYQNLTRELPGLLEALRASRSLTIGVNLDQHLQPVEAALLSVNNTHFESSGFLEKFFGKNKQRWTGLAPVHSALGPSAPNLIGTPLPPEIKNPTIR